MKFRLVDRILGVDGASIRTEKAVSFEEFSLLKPWGRKGALPETLILQVAVDSAAFLVAHLSGGQRTGVLEEAEARFENTTAPGAVLRCEVRRGEGGSFPFTITDGPRALASGTLRLRELPLEDCYDPEAFQLLREALHASSRS